MASIRTRSRKDGSNSHTVTWRDPDRGLQSRTSTDSGKAQELKDFLDANGNSFKLGAQAKIRKNSIAPTVSVVVKEHLDLLRRPQPGTIAKYRRMAAAHIDESDLGRTPVDQVHKPAVVAWLDSLKVRQGANTKPGEPLGRKSKQNVQALLSAAFKTAQESGAHDEQPCEGDHRSRPERR